MRGPKGSRCALARRRRKRGPGVHQKNGGLSSTLLATSSSHITQHTAMTSSSTSPVGQPWVAFLGPSVSGGCKKWQ